jgi:hypothetical protein
MNDVEYERERRRQTRLERLGTNNPKCLFCWEDDPACLELHHLAGKGFGDETVITCRNCHRKLTDKQKEHPPAIAEVTTLERRGRLLLGIADGLELLNCREQLVTLIRQTGLDLIEEGQLSNPTDGEQP